MALVFGDKLAGLLRQIDQYGARFDHRERRTAGPVGVDDGGNLVIGVDGGELGQRLLTLAQMHEVAGVRKPDLLQHHEDLAVVAAAPAIEIDHRANSLFRRFAHIGGDLIGLDHGIAGLD